MKYREKLGYIAVGGVLMLVGMLAANLTPLTAQRDTFGEITCTGLKVVDSEGRDGVVLDAATGVYVWGRGKFAGCGGVFISVDERGGNALFGGKKASVYIGADEHGGKVNVSGKNGSAVVIRNDDRGGQVKVKNRHGKDVALMDVYKKNGRGRIFRASSDGESKVRVVMTADEYGGVSIGADVNGDGVVNVFDLVFVAQAL